MSATLFPAPLQWLDNNGNPLSGGKVYTFIAGTSTLKTTWANYAKSVTNPNPVILDGAGRAEIWGDGGYKVVVTTADDVTVDTTDNIFLLGNTVDGNLSVGGGATFGGGASFGDSVDITGGLIVDHTSDPVQYPVKFTHSNVWSNLDTFGTNSVIIESTGLNNNQPTLILKKDVDDSNLGNAASLILQNSGTRTATQRFGVDLEMVASNAAVDSVNGKFEIGVLSAFASGVGEAGGGLWYLAPRRKANTGFDRMINIYQLSRGGRIEHTGEGLSIRPVYDPADTANVTWSAHRAFIDLTAPFTNAELNVSSTLSTGNTLIDFTSGSAGSASISVTGGTGTATKIELFGGAGTYSRTRSSTGSSSVFIQQDDATGDAVFEMRANWLVAGSRSSIINLYTDAASSASGFRFIATSTTLSFRSRAAGVDTTPFSISKTADGRATFQLISSTKKGEIQLGDGSGTRGGGRVTYDSDTGVYVATGDRMTFNGLRVGRRVASAPANSAATGEAGDFFADDSFFYVYGATGWRRVAVSSF